VEALDEMEVRAIEEMEVVALDEEKVRVLLCICLLLSVFGDRQ